MGSQLKTNKGKVWQLHVYSSPAVTAFTAEHTLRLSVLHIGKKKKNAASKWIWFQKSVF